MPNARTKLGILLLVPVVIAAGACDGAQFNTNYAPGFAPSRSHMAVSIVGVFREGRLSPESWAVMGAPLSAPLGERICDAAYSDKLQNARPDLFARIDEDVRANGVTDELLAQLAPKTDGELLLTLSVLGKVELAQVSTAPSPEPPAPQGARGAPAGGGRTRGHVRGGTKRVEFHGLELSASMFSVKQHRSVGRLTMHYDGTSLDEALKLFAERLGAELPGSTCRPWSWGEAAPAPAIPSEPPMPPEPPMP